MEGNARLAEHVCRCAPRKAVVVSATETYPVQHLGTGDSSFVPNVLPDDAASGMLERIRDEIEWCVMRHKGGEVPRLVSMQATISDDGVCIPRLCHEILFW